MPKHLNYKKQFSKFTTVIEMFPNNLIVMRPNCFLLLLALLINISFSHAQLCEDSVYRNIPNNAWVEGEHLKFKIYYESLLTGKLNAGTAQIEVKKTNRKFDNREVFHIVGTGKSNRAFDLFFKVRDRFETYMDKKALISHHFIRRTKEGGYVRDDDITFNHRKVTATSRKKTKTISPNIQDIISAVYYARTLSADTLKNGDYIYVNFYLDDSLYVSAVQFQGRETIETELGIFNCLAFKPMVATGEVFSNPYPMTLWVTDDENKLPVLAKSAVIIGSVKMELTNYSGLKNELRSKIK